jgi:hypothetical protein
MKTDRKREKRKVEDTYKTIHNHTHHHLVVHLSRRGHVFHSHGHVSGFVITVVRRTVEWTI